MDLRPFLVIHRVTELSPEWLGRYQMQGLLLDLDNTLTPYHSDNIPEDILSWIDKIKKSGIKFMPYSNARAYRIRNFCDRFEIGNPGVAIKPFNAGLGRTLRILKVPKEKVLIVGDQVFTDCLAGILSGIKVALVDPVSPHEFPATRFMRKIERLIGRSRWLYDRLQAD